MSSNAQGMPGQVPPAAYYGIHEICCKCTNGTVAAAFAILITVVGGCFRPFPLIAVACGGRHSSVHGRLRLLADPPALRHQMIHEDNLPAANGVDADEVEPNEPVLCPWEEYRCAFRILALWAKRMACQVAGDNHPKIENVWLHAILKEAGCCRPFVNIEGNSEQPTPSYAPSAIPDIRPGFQDIVHGQLTLPYGPDITSVHVQTRAKDQGWWDHPSGGSWVIFHCFVLAKAAWA